MATYSNTGKFIDAYGADGVISRSELNNYTGSNWEKILNQASKGKFRLGSKAEDYVKSQFAANPYPNLVSQGPTIPLPQFDSNPNSVIQGPTIPLPQFGADLYPNSVIQGPTIPLPQFDSNPNSVIQGPTIPLPQFDVPLPQPTQGIPQFDPNPNLVSQGPTPAQYGYSSNYQPSSDTGSQSSTPFGPNTGSGDMVKGSLTTYDLSDPSDIAYMQTYEPDFYRNLVTQGQIPGVNIGDLPPLEEEEEVYIPPTGGVDLTGGAYQPGSGSGETVPGGSVDSGGSDSGGSPGGQGGGDVTDVETPAEPYVPTDADRYSSIQRGLEHDAGLGGFNPLAYLAAYSDISDLAEDFIQEGASARGGEEDYLGAINARGGTNFSDFSQMDPTDATFMVAREHAERFGFDEGRLDKEKGAYAEKLAEFNTGNLDNFITDLRSGKLKANTSSKTQLQTILGTFPEGQS